MIWNYIGSIVSFIWTFALFKIGRKDKNKVVFYSLLYLPLLIPFFVGLIVFPTVYVDVFNMLNLSVWFLILLIALIVERVAWGFTLKLVSGNDELVWFYFVYYIPLFGWLLYRATKLR